MMGLLIRVVAVGFVCLGTVGSSLAQNCRWTDRLLVPPPRQGESIAYDSARGVIVLFGGMGAGSVTRPLGDTWEWDGQSWSFRSVIGPSPRASHKMVYDSARGVVVLFGGTSNAETWEWDGEQWDRRATTGPSERRFHAMAYDAGRGVTVLHGGASLSGANWHEDTWEWDGTEWRRVARVGPGLTPGLEMVYDSHRGVLVLQGSREPITATSEVWEWTGRVWTLRSTTAPTVYGTFTPFEMVYDSVRRVIVVSTWDWVWEYDGIAWSKSGEGGPYGRSPTFGFAFDSLRGVSVMLLLTAPQPMAQWDGVAWSDPMKPRPPFMDAPAMVYDASENAAIVVGSDHSWTPVQTWAWDGAEWDLRTTGGPSPRVEHAMAYDSVRGVTTLFGGLGETEVSGETWEFDGHTWASVSSTGPSPRKGVSMAFDPVRNVIVLHGGDAPSFNASQEVWEWNGVAWTRQLAFPDVWISRSAMAFDTQRNVLVLAGNTMSRQSTFDTWEFDGTGWAFRSTMPPINRGSMIFDESRGEIVYLVNDEAWVWNGSDWALDPSRGGATSGTVASGKVAAYDTARDVMVLLSQEAPVTSIWEYNCDCYADCDASGTLDVFDFLCFQNGFFRGDPAACNCDKSTGNNVCDIFDFLCFQSAFVGGCP